MKPGLSTTTMPTMPTMMPRVLAAMTTLISIIFARIIAILGHRRIGHFSGAALYYLVQLASVQPNASALRTEVDFDPLAV